MRGRILPVVVSIASLSACQGLERTGDDYGHAVAREVERRVAAGQWDDARRFVDEALESDAEDPYLHFIDGWLHSALADEPGADRPGELVEAESAYARAVALQPGYRSAILNQAIVLDELEELDASLVRPDGSVRPTALEVIERLVGREPVDEITYSALLIAGDVHVRLGEAAALVGDAGASLAHHRQALAAYTKAVDGRPQVLPARWRHTLLLIALADREPSDEWTDSLWSVCQDNMRDGFPQIAAPGFQFLASVRGSVEGEPPDGHERREELRARAHCLWLVCSARQGALTVLELPAEEVPERSLPELELLVEDPEALARVLAEEPDHYWTSSRSRAYAMTLALQAAARDIRLRAAPDSGGEPSPARVEELARSARILDLALHGIAPSAGGDEREYAETDEGLEELLGPAIQAIRIDVALDLLLLYHTYAALRFDEAGEDRLWVLLGEEPLSRYASRWWELDESVAATGKDLVRIHTILGFVFAETKQYGWESMAQLHLEAAREEAKRNWEELRRIGGREYELALARLEASGVADSEDRPLPYLAEAVGVGLTEQSDADRHGDGLGGPGGAYLEAARGYLAGGAPSAAYGLFDDARRARDIADDRFYDLEQLLFEKYGWYAGASYGVTYTDESSSDLRHELDDAGNNIIDVDLDDSDNLERVFVGYRFRGPWALELAAVNQGDYNSHIEASSSLSDLQQDVENTHPLTGRGISLGLLGFAYDRDRLGAFAKAGYWWWDSDLEVGTGSSKVKIDENGFDPFVGAGLQYRVLPQIYLRLEVERYYLDDDHVDALFGSVHYAFGAE